MRTTVNGTRKKRLAYTLHTSDGPLFLGLQQCKSRGRKGTYNGVWRITVRNFKRTNDTMIGKVPRARKFKEHIRRHALILIKNMFLLI